MLEEMSVRPSSHTFIGHLSFFTRVVSYIFSGTALYFCLYFDAAIPCSHTFNDGNAATAATALFFFFYAFFSARRGAVVSAPARLCSLRLRGLPSTPHMRVVPCHRRVWFSRVVVHTNSSGIRYLPRFLSLPLCSTRDTPFLPHHTTACPGIPSWRRSIRTHATLP